MKDRTGFRPALLAVLLAGLVTPSYAGCSSNSAPTVDTATLHEVVPELIMAYTCSGVAFSTGDTTIVVYCVDGAWQDVTATCGSTAITDCADPAPVIDGADAADPIVPGQVVSYSCTGTQSWLSGEPKRVSQCRDGAWVQVLDVCDEACDIPRDCHDVEQLGFTVSDKYMVVPTGNAIDSTVQVFCDLSDNDVNGGHWTVILNNNGVDMEDTDGSMYDTGFMDDANNTFIGLEHLHKLTLEMDGTLRPHVLEVHITLDSGESYIASYSNFTLASSTETYAISSLGTYYGDAGDGLCPHVHTTFAKDADSIGWWGDVTTRTALIEEEKGSLLTTAAPTWEPLSVLGSIVTKAKMRIRPVVFDNTMTCPPTVGVEPYWTTTTGQWTYERIEGTIVNYTCNGFGMVEPTSGNTMGSITCENDGNGVLAWDSTITLPCKLQCPTNFVMSFDETACNHFSADGVTAPSMHMAAIKCMELGASLGRLRSPLDLDTMIEGTDYYTAHTVRSPGLTLFPNMTLDPGIFCEDECSYPADKECVVARKNGSYSGVACETTEANYMCTLPAMCPDGYTSADGGCYKAVDATSLEAGEVACNGDKVSMAYPFTLAQMDSIVKAMAKDPTFAADTEYLIGINYADDTWTSNALYPDLVPDAEMEAKLGTNEEMVYRSLTITDATTYSVNAISWEHGTAVKAICQWQTPSGCFTDPPVLLGDMTFVNISTRAFNDIETYTCDEGFFVDGNITVVRNQSSVCRGTLGEWTPPTLLPCLRVKVCESKIPEITNPAVTNVTDDESFYLGGNVTYICQANMGLYGSVVEVNQTVSCGADPTNLMVFDYTPAFQNCTVCMGEPSVANATTDYDATLSYVYDPESPVYTNPPAGASSPAGAVVAACNASHEAAFNLTVQNIPCTEDGWNTTGLLPCKMACLELPPPAVANLTMADITVRWPGTEVEYTCDPGTFLESNGSLPVESSTKAVCGDDGVWTTERGDADLSCFPLCTSDPAAPPAGANTTWLGDGTDSRRLGTVVTYTSPAGTLWGNRTDEIFSVCDNGTWTTLDAQTFIYSTACLGTLPATIGDAPHNWHGLPGWVDEEFNYTCVTGQATAEGEYHTGVVCDDSGEWVPQDESLTMANLTDIFLCENACPGPPVDAPLLSTYNFTMDFREGTVIEYHCPGFFDDGNETYINECSGGNWTVFEFPTCLTTTSAGPTTPGPIVLPTAPVDASYQRTTDAYYGTLQTNMTDTDGIDAEYIATDAPFGFGYAVLLESEKEQCLMQDNFNLAEGTKPCMSDPGSCPDGISFSIWEKHYFSADIFSRYNAMTDDDIKYVLSTGGDETGHPGIALYHHGIYQVAIVSTGTQYWKVRVPGQMFNGSWCNIGIRWNPTIEEGTNGVPISGGLHMLINLKVVGHSYLPVTTAAAKPGLDPDELMLGCHKTQSDTTYRHFGDGEYDELASWNRALPENETLYFLGGYEGNFSNVTPEQMAEMLERVNLKDPDQFAAALTILGKMTQDNEKPTNAPDTTASSTAILDTSPTPSGPNQLSALSEAESLQRREALLDIMNTILNVDNLGDADGQLTKAQGVPYLDTLNLASNLLDKKSAHEWHNIQANGSAGSADLMWKLDTFMKAAFCRIRYDNDSAPLTVVKSTKNIIFVGQKMLVEDLRANGAYVELPDFNIPELRDKKIEWNNIYDSIRVPTGVLNDDRCDKRPICVITIIYDSYDDVGPSPVNFANVPKDTIQKMDSRVISFKISADKGRKPLYTGEVDKSAPLCWPDPIVLNKDPFYFRVEHNTPTVSVNRGLKFHSEEVVTQVLDRRCAWWNANLSDYGVFDSSGCEIHETSALSTSCICNRFGIVVVLAEQVKPAEVPPEEYWLSLVKYILYAISGLLLIFYSVVVLYSPDLKEQFHLLGMNVSLAVLLGSVFMCVSDMHSIRESRHMCTTISTLIHFFYVAAGGLMACMGHASFKAITSGVVGGKLNAYACIAWGLALVSVGVPFAFFITDLGTDPRCFISWENYGKATFFLPQMIYVNISFFFGFVVICNLSTPALRKENLIDDFGSFCRGASFVLLYFSITWTLGMFAYMRFDLTTDFFPMFQIMNSMLGIIIFLFIGLASKRYRGVLVGKAKAKQQKIMSMAGQKGPAEKQKLKEDPTVPPPKPVTPAAPVSSRPSTGASLRPPSSGLVAGRPGSRPVTPQL